MEEIGIIICLKKKKQRLKEYQKNYCESKKSILDEFLKIHSGNNINKLFNELV